MEESVSTCRANAEISPPPSVRPGRRPLLHTVLTVKAAYKRSWAQGRVNRAGSAPLPSPAEPHRPDELSGVRRCHVRGISHTLKRAQIYSNFAGFVSTGR